MTITTMWFMDIFVRAVNTQSGTVRIWDDYKRKDDVQLENRPWTSHKIGEAGSTVATANKSGKNCDSPKADSMKKEKDEKGDDSDGSLLGGPYEQEEAKDSDDSQLGGDYEMTEMPEQE